MNGLYEQTKYEHFIRDFISNCKDKPKRQCSWDDFRNKLLKEQKDRDMIFSMEIREVNSKTFNDLIPNELTQQTTANSFFESLIKRHYIINNQGIGSETVTQRLVEQKERLETKKRILNKYLDYLLNYHLKYLISGFDHLKDVENKFIRAYQQEQLLKSKLSSIKRHYMHVSSRILINKVKRQTLISIHSNLIQLFKWTQEHARLTDINNNTIKTFKEITSLQAEIKSSPYSNRSLICSKIIQSLLEYQEHLNANYEEDVITSFLKLNNNINSLFTDFLLIKCKQDLTSFVLTCFKKSLFRIFKGTFISFSNNNEDSIIINSNTFIKCLKDFALISFEEKKLFSAFKFLWANMSIVVSNYSSYMTKSKCSIINNGKDNGISNFFEFNKELFAEVLQKKLIKLLIMFESSITGFSFKQNTYQMLASINIMGIIIQKGFGMDCFPDKMAGLFNSLIKKSLRNECKCNIKRIGVFLNADLLKRTMIKNINE